MIGLNEELKLRKDNPVKIGLIGCGQMGVDVIATTRDMVGVKICIVCDIDEERAKTSYDIAQIEGAVIKVNSVDEAVIAIAAGQLAYTTDYRIITDLHNIDVMLESTGVPEIGAKAALRSARSGQQLAMMNVETDITVGPILNWYAKKQGVKYALAAGDEPAACKELYDFAESCGFTIVAAGKGKNNPLDRYAKPTDEVWVKDAARRGLNPNMLIEFVDGSKTMIEMASTSNATGLVPDVRGMHGPKTTKDNLNKVFALKKDGGILNKTGVVDYSIGGIHPGVFMIVTTDHPRLRQALVYRDMGDGPYYTLFRPFHLCGIEVPLTFALLEIRKQTNMAPLDRLVSEVFAVAKQDLNSGDVLDGIGGCTYYSLIDTYEIAKEERLLPIGLAKNAKLNKPVKKDAPITYNDVELFEPSTILELRKLQDLWIDKNVDETELLEKLDVLSMN